MHAGPPIVAALSTSRKMAQRPLKSVAILLMRSNVNCVDLTRKRWEFSSRIWKMRTWTREAAVDNAFFLLCCIQKYLSTVTRSRRAAWSISRVVIAVAQSARGDVLWLLTQTMLDASRSSHAWIFSFSRSLMHCSKSQSRRYFLRDRIRDSFCRKSWSSKKAILMKSGSFSFTEI